MVVWSDIAIVLRLARLYPVTSERSAALPFSSKTRPESACKVLAAVVGGTTSQNPFLSNMESAYRIGLRVAALIHFKKYSRHASRNFAVAYRWPVRK